MLPSKKVNFEPCAQPSLGFTENGPEKIKYPVNGSCVDENALLMSEVRRE